MRQLIKGLRQHVVMEKRKSQPVRRQETQLMHPKCDPKVPVTWLMCHDVIAPPDETCSVLSGRIGNQPGR